MISKQPNHIEIWESGIDAGLTSKFDVSEQYKDVASRRLSQLGFIHGDKLRRIAVPNCDEHAHQVALFAWANETAKLIPELHMLFAIPNGGLRAKTVAAKLKAEGVKAGVPDVCLPIPKYGSGALYIEMKSSKGRVSDDQKKWLGGLDGYGNTAIVCFGWLSAREAIKDYLSGGSDE